MKPFQLFLRDVVAPTLSDLGFKGRGSTYRYVRPGGHQATFFFHQFRLGHKELEFLIDGSVLVQEWIAYKREARNFKERGVDLNAPVTPFERADTASGPVRSRLDDPDAQAGLPWQFDLDDAAARGRFVDLLTVHARELIELTDPANFEERLRRRDPALRRHMLMPEEVSLAIVLAGQGRFAEADEFLPGTTEWFSAEKLQAWVEARRAAGRREVRKSEA